MTMKIKVGDKIKIISMSEEPHYTGKIGIVTKIDDAKQIHGTWGGLALLEEIDKFEILESKEEK
jgi:hypothetical protein